MQSQYQRDTQKGKTTHRFIPLNGRRVSPTVIYMVTAVPLSTRLAISSPFHLYVNTPGIASVKNSGSSFLPYLRSWCTLMQWKSLQKILTAMPRLEVHPFQLFPRVCVVDHHGSGSHLISIFKLCLKRTAKLGKNKFNTLLTVTALKCVIFSYIWTLLKLFPLS